MTSAIEILQHVVDETNAARAHYQIWWALRNIALPEFYSVMNDHDYVEFFHASNSGHYKLMFVAIGKIFDSDTRTAGIRELKSALHAEGHGAVVNRLEDDLTAANSQVERILTIRNRSVLHNEHALRRERVYELGGGITANDIRDVISVTTEAVNSVVDSLGYGFRVSVGTSYERATLAMLDRLCRGGA